MPHISHPTFRGGRLREVHTEEGWIKYVPAGPEGGLDTYQFDKEDLKFDRRMDQLRFFLLGHITIGECTLLSDEEKNLAVYGSKEAPTTPPAAA